MGIASLPLPSFHSQGSASLGHQSKSLQCTASREIHFLPICETGYWEAEMEELQPPCRSRAGAWRLEKQQNFQTLNLLIMPFILILGGSSTDDRWASLELKCSTYYTRKVFPFDKMVRESENNVEHLRSRGALICIFLSRHSSFGRRSRVHGKDRSRFSVGTLDDSSIPTING